jgi:hypothetical protein
MAEVRWDSTSQSRRVTRKNWRSSMDFIERWFGLSPDGGDGSMEVLYLGVAVVILAIFLWRGRIRAMLQKWRS